MLQPNDIIYVPPIKDNFFRSINNLTNIVSISLSAVTLFLLINQKLNSMANSLDEIVDFKQFFFKLFKAGICFCSVCFSRLL